MKVRRHPKTDILKDWLDGGGNAEVDVHVATCHRCTESLEALAAEIAPREEDLVAMSSALAAVLEPPEDLADRLEQRVAARLDSGQMLGVLADLFGAGFETSKLLFTDDIRDARG